MNDDLQAMLDAAGMRKSGDYDPARPQPDGRWSVDADTLALLLSVYLERRA